MQAGLNLLDNKIHLFFCDTRNVKVDEDFIDCCKGSFPPNEYADIMKFVFSNAFYHVDFILILTNACQWQADFL